MADSNRTPAESAAKAARGEQPAKGQQGVYGSGGSYGVGGGFEEGESRNNTPAPRESAPDGLDMQGERARGEAQQEGAQKLGFQREVDPDAAPPDVPDQPRTQREQELAERNRRGSRT